MTSSLGLLRLSSMRWVESGIGFRLSLQLSAGEVEEG